MGVYEDTIAQYGYTVPNQIFRHSALGYDLIACHDSGNNSERYTQLTLGQYPDNLVRFPVVQVMVPDPRPGDLLVVMGDGQVTSERNTNTEIISRLIWATGSGATSGTEMGEENGENVDLNRHHHKLHNFATFEVPTGTPSGALRYVTWVWGAFNGATLPQYVTVDQDYTRLHVLQFRPRSA